MSWKAFVLGHHPDAVCVRNGAAGRMPVSRCFRWGIFVGGLGYYFGATPALAWKNGAENILRVVLP